MPLILAILMIVVVVAMKNRDDMVRYEREAERKAIEAKSDEFMAKYCDEELENTLERLIDYEREHGPGPVTEEISQFFRDLCRACPSQAKLSERVKALCDYDKAYSWLLCNFMHSIVKRKELEFIGSYRALDILLANRGKIRKDLVGNGYISRGYNGPTDPSDCITRGSEDTFWILKYLQIKLCAANPNIPELVYVSKVYYYEWYKPLKKYMRAVWPEGYYYTWITSPAILEDPADIKTIPGRYTPLTGDYEEFLIKRAEPDTSPFVYRHTLAEHNIKTSSF